MKELLGLRYLLLEEREAYRLMLLQKEKSFLRVDPDLEAEDRQNLDFDF